MKKTRLVLASLTAIILLSCNSVENSSSSEEDLDFSQTPTLKIAASSVTSNAGTASVSLVSPGSTSSSLVTTLTFPGGGGQGTITSLEFCCSSSSGSGYFTVNSLRIWCGSKNTTVNYSGSCVTTSAFNSSTIPSSCSFQFTGKCNSTSTSSCTKTLSSCRFVAYH